MRRVGLCFPGQPYSLQEVVDGARRAEALGFDSVWIAEDYWTGRDGLSVLSCLALNTDRIRLGTAVINPYTRHPILIAMTFNTLSEVAPGRLILGIGAGTPWKPLVAEEMSQRPPLRAIREAVASFRHLLTGRNFTWGNETVTLAVQRECFRGARSPTTLGVPVYIGASGPRMTELAGEIGDGLLLGTGTRVDEVGARLEHLAAGANRAGRDRKSIDVAAIVMTSVTKDGKVDANALAYAAKGAAGLDDANVWALGFDPEQVRRVREEFNQGHCEEACRLLSPAMVSAFVAAGAPSDCVRTLNGFVRAGVDLPLLLPFGGSVSDVIKVGEAFARLEEHL